MKKRFLTLILTLTAMFMCIFGLTACEKEISFKLNFVVDNEIYATIDTSGDEVITLPESPKKENHSFDGWYWDKDTWQTPFTANSLLDAPLSSDMSVYAKFSLNIINGVTFENVETTYDGTEKTIAVNNLPDGASVVYDKANTYINAGEYTVTATVSQENDEDLQLTATLTINKAIYDMSGVVFVDKTVTYNGESHSITATNLPNGVTAQYTGNNQINADEYTITATFTGDSVNYESIADKTATLTINKASVSKPAQDSTSFVYNGNEQTYQLADNSLYTISGNKQTNAGNHNVIISLKDKNNYQWYDETVNDLSYSFNIAKAVYDMSAVTFENKTVTYDGKIHSLAVSDNLPNGVSVSYTNNDKISANQYIVTATFTGDSINYYAINDMQAMLTINKASYDMSGVSFVGGRFTYDGTQKFIYVTGELPDGVTVNYTNNGKINANTYTVTATFTGDTENYNKLPDWTASLIIDKATYDMSGISFKNQTFTYDTTAKNALITGTLPNGVEVSYVGNGKTDVGTYTVTANFNGDSNNYHLIGDMTATLKINQAVPYIKEVSCNQSLNVYSTVELVADTNVAGTIALDNGQTLTLGYKTYSWTFIPEDTHNYANATGTLGLTVCALVSYYNDGVLFSSQNIVLNNSATVPTGTPLRADANGYRYTFSHWSIEENGAEYNFTNAITADLNLYAVYDSEEIVYAINYYETMNAENSNIETFTVSTETIFLSIEKEHYVFNGWTDKNGNEVTKINKGTFGTLDLYATWTPIEYVITYDLGYRGAVNGNNPTTYNVEDALSLASATYDEYHTFVGWYLEENYVNEKSSISVGESGAITLYAKWNFSGTYISTAEEFKNISYKMDGVYELKNDITINFTLGDSTNPFTGYLLGAEHYINGNAIICSINSGYLGYVNTNQQLCYENKGTIDMCSAYGISTNNIGTIKNCISKGFSQACGLSTYYGGQGVGGISSYNTGTIKNCKVILNTNIIFESGYNSDTYIAGIACQSEGQIENCYVEYGLTINYNVISYAEHPSLYVAGLCVYNKGEMSDCYISGMISITTNSNRGSAWLGMDKIQGVSGTKCFSALSSLSITYSNFNYGPNCIYGSNYYNQDVNCNLNISGGTGCNAINFMSRKWIQSNLGWDESIWYLQDGQYPKLWFEVE